MKIQIVVSVALATILWDSGATNAQRWRGEGRRGLGVSQALGELRGRVSERREVFRDRLQEPSAELREREQASFQEGYQAAMQQHAMQQREEQRALAVRPVEQPRSDGLPAESDVRVGGWQPENDAYAGLGPSGATRSYRPVPSAGPQEPWPLQADRSDDTRGAEDDSVARFNQRLEPLAENSQFTRPRYAPSEDTPSLRRSDVWSGATEEAAEEIAPYRSQHVEPLAGGAGYSEQNAPLSSTPQVQRGVTSEAFQLPSPFGPELELESDTSDTSSSYGRAIRREF